MASFSGKKAAPFASAKKAKGKSVKRKKVSSKTAKGLFKKKGK